jgi:hypothetical protein
MVAAVPAVGYDEVLSQPSRTPANGVSYYGSASHPKGL